MDNKLDRYRSIIRQILLQHAELVPSHGEIEVRPVFDPANDSYLLVDSGWDRTRRIHAAVIDLRVKDGKVWIEADGTERGIAYELLDAGVPESDIVLGFMHPSRRKFIEFDPVP
ncbi:MAG TPA: XisI protein [Caldilineaceae bacterium]|nr:XisI protein [Caldilineaceae bacterium]